MPCSNSKPRWKLTFQFWQLPSCGAMRLVCDINGVTASRFSYAWVTCVCMFCEYRLLLVWHFVEHHVLLWLKDSWRVRQRDQKPGNERGKNTGSDGCNNKLAVAERCFRGQVKTPDQYRAVLLWLPLRQLGTYWESMFLFSSFKVWFSVQVSTFHMFLNCSRLNTRVTEQLRQGSFQIFASMWGRSCLGQTWIALCNSMPWTGRCSGHVFHDLRGWSDHVPNLPERVAPIPIRTARPQNWRTLWHFDCAGHVCTWRPSECMEEAG